MNYSYRAGLITAVSILCFAAGIFFINSKNNPPLRRIQSSSSPHASKEMKMERFDYFLTMLRDPKTGRIPPFIRQQELKFAKSLANRSLRKTVSNDWNEAGPNNVGGRTRALAVDITNANIVIAGGASGGIWKSTDKGASWVLKSSTSTILSTTTIAQDPRPGFTNIWYYGTGEYSGSGNDRGFTAYFTGDGIYKSTDNGETWNVLPSTLSTNIAQWESNFDYVLKIAVSPVNGDVFVAANGSGIYRSEDGGGTFQRVLGGNNQHVYSDISIASNGTLAAVISSPYAGITATDAPGVYKSVDNGTNWTSITPATFPASSARSVICFAPSNSNVAYLLTETGQQVNNREEIKFFKLNVANGTNENRSANLPDFSAMGGTAADNGFLTTQGGYDMVVAVKPDNENYVLIAGTSLFRSSDGFASQPFNNVQAWIGGYNNNSFFYPSFHPDVHSFSFDPTDGDKMWWGHDGGLSYTSNIRNSAFSDYFPWENKNHGYNVTQFYHISISPDAGDNRIMGGCQDNGTPFFRYTGTPANSSDVSSGDGSYSYMGRDFAYTSSQNGTVNRLRYDSQGNPSFNTGWSTITPTGATNMSFINPFCVDPNNENVMYYPAGNVLWRNNQLGSIPNNQNGTSVGWAKLDNFSAPAGYSISTIAISQNPSGVLYYGASSSNGVAKIYKVTDASTATSGAVDISVPDAPAGAYLHNIAINPDDANEIIAVFSNYNIIGLYHSTDGGQSYTAIEGNLQGTTQNPGPSLRAASILPSDGGKTFFIATSVGLFSTKVLNGNNTVWTQEGADKMGNVIVNYVVTRKSDGTIVAATHGRGAFIGKAGTGGGPAVLSVNSNQIDFEVKPGASATRQISINNTGESPLSFNISALSTQAIKGSRNIIYSAEKPGSKSLPFSNLKNTRLSKAAFGSDSLYVDDGNSTPDDFFGIPGESFYWMSSYTVESDFSLDRIKFYIRSENSSSANTFIAVSKIVNNAVQSPYLYQTQVPLPGAGSGGWYTLDLSNPISFSTGETFVIILGNLTTAIQYPAGIDYAGIKPGNSYYYDNTNNNWPSLGSANASWVNAGWLIRAFGTGASGSNQDPVANVQVSPNPAAVNQNVSFDGSGSHDPDGQIASYLWDFGDGVTATSATANHAYSQAGQYNFSLTVTDNKGATDQAAGVITINSGQPAWTVTPNSGTIQPGGSQPIDIKFNSGNLPEGTYHGQITITSNGGNTIIPVNIVVTNTAGIENNSKVMSYKLEQNFPNPFNPSTTINWGLAQPGFTTLKVYNINGQEVATLVNEFRDAGRYSTLFNAQNINGKTLASGVYLYKIVSGNFTETKKFVLLK